MATKKEEAVETLAVDDDVVDQIAADLAKKNAAKQTGHNAPRTRKAIGNQGAPSYDDKVPVPSNIKVEDAGPTAFFAVRHGEITGFGDTQEFTINEEAFKYLPFTKPGQRLAGNKRQYTVKAIHKNGTLIQLSVANTMNNQVSGDREDYLGLRGYIRKGITILMDLDTDEVVYCPAWGCWARANNKEFYGFCTMYHAEHTQPNRFRELSGLSIGATTSKNYLRRTDA
jgi:hypothetical protein